MDLTSPIKQTKKPPSKSVSRPSVLSPRTLSRISRPQRRDLSPSPFPTTSRKIFKSTPKKQKLSQSAGVLNRLQKIEVNIQNTAESKKVRKVGLRRVDSTMNSQQKQVSESVSISLDDGAVIQVPATPAPNKKRNVLY